MLLWMVGCEVPLSEVAADGLQGHRYFEVLPDQFANVGAVPQWTFQSDLVRILIEDDRLDEGLLFFGKPATVDGATDGFGFDASDAVLLVLFPSGLDMPNAAGAKVSHRPRSAPFAFALEHFLNDFQALGLNGVGGFFLMRRW